jgi:hypothetical protein
VACHRQRLDRQQVALVDHILKPDLSLKRRAHRVQRHGPGLIADNAIGGQRIVDTGAHFRSLAEPWADTSTSAGRLMIAVFGALADVERDLIRTRTVEGRARAKARGVKLGPKFKLTPDERKEALARRAAGETTTALGRDYNVSHTTISRLRS